jgi:signal transduction histidine kinase
MSARPNVLLVDDLEENLYVLASLLRREDAELLRARSGREALELLLVHDVALALVDVQMPEMDGFELAELVRGSERTREIPIIFVTAGLHDQARVFKGYESGAVDFLFKPLDPTVLRSKVSVFLELYRNRQQLAARLRQLETLLREREQAAAALREVDRRKNAFIAALSHELRNPLAPIRNSVYVLGRVAAGSDEARRAHAVIDRQVAQLARLVDDLLDVTRISLDKIELQRQRLELNELVRRTVDDHRSLFEQGEVSLELALSAHPLFVHADGDRLVQVLGNLLQNAAKFTAAGGRTSVSVGAAPADGHVVIRVADTGVGMTDETLSRLFQPFMQAETSRDRSKGGLGLGLALAKRLVELHGGRVSAASAGVGKGAEFVVALPLAPADAGPRSSGISPARTCQRVLVIEDDVDSAESLRRLLERGGKGVAQAYNGWRGLARARAFRPDAILCDVGLPGLNGYQVARAVRDDADLGRTFLVAVTGYAMPEDLERAAVAGFDHHLAKPVSPERLAQLLGALG